jgi:hypothetical protein
LHSELSELASLRPDLSGIARQIEGMLTEANRVAREAGLDQRGSRLADLAPSTQRGRRRGVGPPLAGHGDASRSISLFGVTATPSALGMSVVVSQPAFLAVHAEGQGRLPVRDITGVPQAALAEADRLVLDELDRQLIEIIDNQQSIRPL